MKRLFYAALLGIAVCSSGCAGFGKYAASTDPATGQSPVANAVAPVIAAAAPVIAAAQDPTKTGLNGFEEGGVYAGILALLLTAGKSAARLYSDYQATKAKKPA